MNNINPAYRAIVIFIIAIWCAYFISLVMPIQSYGLIPRTTQGLIGIFSAPFLHGSFQHLINNSIAFLIFSFVLAALESEKMLAKVLWIIVIGGGLTWIFGRSSNHIGASGLIYGIWGYLMLSGWFSRKIKYILTSIILGVLYSSMIWGVIPGFTHTGVSIESHIFGALAGGILSWGYHTKNTSPTMD